MPYSAATCYNRCRLSQRWKTMGVVYVPLILLRNEIQFSLISQEQFFFQPSPVQFSQVQFSEVSANKIG